jgi:GT2 family glycosyltransferase
VSYGATDEKNRLIAPNGHLQESPGWFTGNVVLVSQQVSERIGIIDDTYTHARADFDYAERLKQAGIQFFVASKFVGVCVNDWKDKMRGKSFGARLASLWRPGYSNIHDLWRIRSRYHGILRALISCLHMITLVFRRVK